MRSCAFALLGAWGTTTSAQSVIPAAELARCAGIAADAVRLACFDELADDLGPEGTVERAATEAAENDDAFGAELIGDSGMRGPNEIQSRLIGEFTGWRGNTTFALENGQVWRQAEESRLVFRSEAPLITIRRGAFGTYRLNVEGVNRAVRVRRIE